MDSEEETAAVQRRSQPNQDATILNQATIDNLYGYDPSRRTLKEKITTSLKRQCTAAQLKASLLSFFPIITWIRQYNWKIDPLRDLLGGITVGIMSIPQGMSYALLIRIPVVYGLYTNIIPTMIYCFVGTSKHGAVGTVTMVSIILGQMRLKYVPDVHDLLTPACYHRMANISWNKSQDIDPSIFDSPACFSATQMVITMSMLGGIMLAIMGLLRLGFVAAYLSDCVVDAFTSGAAVIVITAQIDFLLGLHLTPYTGPGKVFMSYMELFRRITEINTATLIISCVTVVFLIIMKEFVNTRVQRRFLVPIPSEMLVLIVAIIVSYYCRFETNYNVGVLGPIPSGFPSPKSVRFDIMPELFLDTLLVTIVNYSSSLSLAKVMAKKNNYKIDGYQEFYALSIINIVGSIFQSFQSGVSVARTIVYESTGAKSQFAGLIGTICVIICVMWLTPYLYALPQAILGSIIVVACIQLLKNLRQLKILWKVSKVDFAIFLITFVAVVIFDVSVGLAISILFSFLTVIFRTQFQHLRRIGRLGESNFYGEISRYHKAEEIPYLKIFQFRAPLYYANAEEFKFELCELCVTSNSRANGNGTGVKAEYSQARPTCVIVDCAGIIYIDIMGISAVKEAYSDLHASGLTVFFAAVNPTVRRTMQAADIFSIVPKENFFFSVNDAVAEMKGSKGSAGYSTRFDQNRSKMENVYTTMM